MRLINTDALIERLKPYKYKYGTDEIPYNIIHEAFIYEIENEPTIEAIPVEWLLEWERKYNESLPPLFRGETVIKEVIRDWRKENEND